MSYQSLDYIADRQDRQERLLGIRCGLRGGLIIVNHSQFLFHAERAKSQPLQRCPLLLELSSWSPPDPGFRWQAVLRVRLVSLNQVVFWNFRHTLRLCLSGRSLIIIQRLAALPNKNFIAIFLVVEGW